MSKISLLPCALWLALQMAQAQTPPSAGGQLQQIPTVPPSPDMALPQVDVQTTGTAATEQPPDAVRFVARRLNVTGASLYTESYLVAIAGFEPGQELTLADLNAMAARITEHYHRDGYLVARAYLPAQEIKDGEVSISVLEGQYGQVTLNNSSRLDSGVADRILQGLDSGDVIATAPLENRLLLLSDLPGVQVRSTLVPGASVGLSDLIVDVTPGAWVNGSVDVDNAGNRYTGVYRLGATLNLNNPAGLGDVATLRAVTSGSGLRYLRGAYQVPMGIGRVGVSYGHLAYELGREFEALGAHGTARIATLFGTYPLIRSRTTNLHAGLSLESKIFQDIVDSTASVTDKRAQVAVATLYGDHRDTVGWGGVSSFSLALSAGNLDIRTPAMLALDAATARSNGHYNKLAFHVLRRQQVAQTVSVLASLSGQMASKNLDVSEKMELGGMYGVRAYPEGEAYADEGYLLTMEVRKQLSSLSESTAGQVYVAAFVDTGAVRINHTPWAAGSNHRRLSGAGVGMYWIRVNDFSVKAFYARKLGSGVATSAPDKSGRFWIQAVKYF